MFLAPDAKIGDEPVRCQNNSCRRTPETHPEEGGWIEFIFYGRNEGTFWCPRCVTDYRRMVEIQNDGN